MNLEERNAEIVRLRGQGVTLDAIGRRYRLSTTRVRQIIDERGGPDAGAASAARARKKQEKALALRQAILRAADANPAATLRELARQTGATHAEVFAALPEEEKARRKDLTTLLVPRSVYIRAVRQVVEEHGLTSIGTAQYDRLRRSHHPSSGRVRQVLGSWEAACRAARVKTAAAAGGRRGGSTPVWDADSVIDWVVAYMTSEDPDFTYRDLDTWLRAQDGAPSAQTVRNRSGLSWTQLLAEGNRRIAQAQSRPRAVRAVS